LCTARSTIGSVAQWRLLAPGADCNIVAPKICNMPDAPLSPPFCYSLLIVAWGGPTATIGSAIQSINQSNFLSS